MFTTKPVARHEQRFSRYEFKYWVDSHTRDRLLKYLTSFMVFDAHCPGGAPYDIYSLYLDTRDLDCYYEKYNGDVERKKYRIRAYNRDFANLFLEIKKKNNIYIQKTRDVVSLDTGRFSDVQDLLFAEDTASDSPFIHACRTLNLAPACWVAYRRIALMGRNNAKIRITFDDGLSGIAADGFRLRDKELRSVSLSNWHRFSVLEIKFDYYLPYWLERCIADLNLSHESISKYGIAVNRFHFHREPERQWTR